MRQTFHLFIKYKQACRERPWSFASSNLIVVRITRSPQYANPEQRSNAELRSVNPPSSHRDWYAFTNTLRTYLHHFLLVFYLMHFDRFIYLIFNKKKHKVLVRWGLNLRFAVVNATKAMVLWGIYMGVVKSKYTKISTCSRVSLLLFHPEILVTHISIYISFIII